MVMSGKSNQDLVQCDQVWREVSNYIDGEVDASLRAGMDEHFKTCARCASLLAGTRNVIQLYGDERMLEVPAGFSQRLENLLDASRVGQFGLGQFRSGRLQSKRWSSWSAWLVPVGAVALIACALVLGDTYMFKKPPQVPMAEQGRGIPPDMLVVVSSGAKLFHVPGCEFIHDKSTERTITAKQAIEDGYVPCTRCLRQYLSKLGFQGNHGTILASAGGDADQQSEEREEQDQDEVLLPTGH